MARNRSYIEQRRSPAGRPAGANPCAGALPWAAVEPVVAGSWESGRRWLSICAGLAILERKFGADIARLEVAMLCIMIE
jgi:hypothetical protein